MRFVMHFNYIQCDDYVCDYTKMCYFNVADGYVFLKKRDLMNICMPAGPKFCFFSVVLM